MSQVDVDSGIENMEVDENDRREKRSLSEKVGGEEDGVLFPSGSCSLLGGPRSPQSSHYVVQASLEVSVNLSLGWVPVFSFALFVWFEVFFETESCCTALAGLGCSQICLAVCSLQGVKMCATMTD